MSKKTSSQAKTPVGLPDDFFDLDKKSKKAQEDDLSKEMEQFEREMAALQAESEEQIREEFDKIQEDKNLEELDQQLDQWKRIVDLERRAEELRNKTISEKPNKKFKSDSGESLNESNVQTRSPTKQLPSISEPPHAAAAVVNDVEDDFRDLDDIESFEDKLFDWRSNAIK